jgi:hypothetical protein
MSAYQLFDISRRMPGFNIPQRNNQKTDLNIPQRNSRHGLFQRTGVAYTAEYRAFRARQRTNARALRSATV